MAPAPQLTPAGTRAGNLQASGGRTTDARSLRTGKSGFLWVNKDASSGSLSSSTATEKYIINRHIQRVRRKARQDRLELTPTRIPQFGLAFRQRSAVDGSPQSDVDASGKCSSPESQSEQTLDHALPSASGNAASGRDVSDAEPFSQWQLTENQQEPISQRTPPNQFTFAQGLLSGRSRRAHELQQSRARSHAAHVAYQRLKSRTSPKDNGSSAKPPTQRPGQAIVPFRPLMLPSPPLSPEDESQEISLINPSPNTVSYTQDPLTPPQPPDALDYYSFQERADCDHSEQEGGDLEYTINTSLATASFQRSYRQTPPPFKISLGHEGFPGLRTDPFLCIPSSGDNRIGSAIDFYSQVVSLGNDTVCYVFNVSNVYASFLETLQDEYFFDAGIGVVQFLLEQIRAPGSQPSVHILKHKGNAIARIHSKLSRPDLAVDDVTIFAMIFLAALDKGLRDPIGHNLHKRNIAMIISQRGGLKSLQNGSVLKGYLMHYDTFWAMETGETIFPGERRRNEPVYPAHPFSTKLCAFITRLPPGFQQLVTECALSFYVLPVLSRATHLTRLSTRGRSELLSKTRRSTKQYNDFWEACPCLCTSDDTCLVFEKLLSLTLICYSYMAFGSRSYPTHLRVSRFETTKKIASYSPRSQAEEDCLIWMWVVVIDSWRMGSLLEPSGVSLLFKLQSRFPALRHVSAVTDIANRFLWTGDLSNSVHMYWDDLFFTG